MVRSLYSGISGLRNHQVSLDVTGNNIANVNTVGFKAGRVTFEESMSQLLKGSSRPPGDAGGTNPIQVGLGMSIGSIDTIMAQGNLQSTGQITDLAIEGRAFFAFSSGEGTFYSRNGALQMDSTGRLVSPTNGYSLQGRMAAVDGTYPIGTRIGDIRIPYGEKAPAKETGVVSYSSNLDSDSEGLGSILHTNRFLASANAGTETLTSMFDENGNDLGIKVGDTLTIEATGTTSVSLVVEDTTTLEDLRAAIEGVVDQISPWIDVNITADGRIEVINSSAPAADIQGLQIGSSRPGSNSYVANAFSFPPTIDPGDTATTMLLYRPAMATDALADVRDASGRALGLEDGDELSVNGAVGGNTIPTLDVVYDSTGTIPDSVADLQDLIDAIQEAFGLPATDGTVYDLPSVSMNGADTNNDRLPDGSIVIRGQPEMAFALSNFSVIAKNNDLDATAPTRFNANMASTEIQAARDTGMHSTSIVVYDESGDAHTMITTFIHSGIPGEWLWEITTEGGEQILGGNTGRITFGQDGSPSAWTFDDNSTMFQFDPMNGSNEVAIQLDVGSPGSFRGITQFRSPSTTAAREQDGYPMGKLQEIAIDEYGDVTGSYTHGISKSIARIFVAEFNNPAGLTKLGDSMFAVSNNSGEAVMHQPGVGSSSTLKAGALEMSNVELATEFTNMITTQRGYQANARVVTAVDEISQETMNMKR